MPEYILLVDENDKEVGIGEKIKTDDIDISILRNLANNAKMSTTDIAKNLDISSITVKNRIERLIKSGVIQGFRYYGDLIKHGFKLYKADINLIDYTKKQAIIEYILKNPHLLIITKSAGHADLELEFSVKDVSELLLILEDLVNKFPNTIKNYDYFYEKEIHKIQYIPQELIE